MAISGNGLTGWKAPGFAARSLAGYSMLCWLRNAPVAPANLLTNPTESGASAGTPGSLPTGWFLSGYAGASFASTGLSVTVSNPGAGTVDVRIFGTTAAGTAGSQCSLFFDSATPVSAGLGYTAAAILQLTAGAFTNVTTNAVAWNDLDGTQTYLDTVAGNTFANPTATPALVSVSTVTTPGAAFIQPTLYFNTNSSAAVNFTLRITSPAVTPSGVLANLVTNPAQAAAATGTPGTLPSGWFLSGYAGASFASTGLSSTVTGVGANSTDLRIFGTTAAGTAGSQCSLFFDTLTPVSAGVSYTAAAVLQLLAGNYTNVTAHAIGWDDKDGGSTYIGTPVSASFANPTATPLLVTGAGLTDTGSVYMQPSIRINMNSSSAVDFTVRITKTAVTLTSGGAAGLTPFSAVTWGGASGVAVSMAATSPTGVQVLEVDGSGNSQGILETGTLSGWVPMLYSHTSAAGAARLYVGDDTNSTAGAGWVPSAFATQILTDLYIGQNEKGQNLATADHQIAEVAIWLGPLGQDEAEVLLNGACPLAVNPSRLLCYFPLRFDLRDYGPAGRCLTGVTPNFTSHPPVDPFWNSLPELDAPWFVSAAGLFPPGPVPYMIQLSM